MPVTDTALAERDYSDRELSALLEGHAQNCYIEGADRVGSIMRQASKRLATLSRTRDELRALVAESDIIPEGEHAKLLIENARLRKVLDDARGAQKTRPASTQEKNNDDD